MEKHEDKITIEMLMRYKKHLSEQEKSPATIQQYLRELENLYLYLQNEPLTKTSLLGWKEHIILQYAPASVNNMLAAVNSFLSFIGLAAYKMKPLKIQREIFSRAERELTREEYVRLVHTAQHTGNERLALILQTVCATGIRVSELQYITAEAVYTCRAQVNCKGKRRTVILPIKLCRLLKKYLNKQKRTTGAVFVTRTGKPLDRSNIWREMKALCHHAHVSAEKVFPHNLRHLFARTYYTLEKDLSRLADILGHSNVNTTRIYTMESGIIHAQQMERMRLIVT